VYDLPARHHGSVITLMMSKGARGMVALHHQSVYLVQRWVVTRPQADDYLRV